MSSSLSRSHRAESSSSATSALGGAPRSPFARSPQAKSRFDEDADPFSDIQLTRKTSSRSKGFATSSPHYNPIHEVGKERSQSMGSDDRSSQRNDSDGENFTTRLRRISAPETYDSLVSSLSTMNPSLAGYAEKLKIRVRVVFHDRSMKSETQDITPQGLLVEIMNCIANIDNQPASIRRRPSKSHLATGDGGLTPPSVQNSSLDKRDFILDLKQRDIRRLDARATTSHSADTSPYLLIRKHCVVMSFGSLLRCMVMHDRLYVIVIPDEKTGYEKSGLLLNIIESSIHDCMSHNNTNDELLQSLVHHESRLKPQGSVETPSLSSAIMTHAWKYSSQMQISSIFFNGEEGGSESKSGTVSKSPSSSQLSNMTSAPPTPKTLQRKGQQQPPPLARLSSSKPTSPRDFWPPPPPPSIPLPPSISNTSSGTELDTLLLDSKEAEATHAHTAIPFSAPSHQHHGHSRHQHHHETKLGPDAQRHTPELPNASTAQIPPSGHSNPSPPPSIAVSTSQLSYELRVYEALFTVVLHVIRGQYEICLEESNKVLGKLSTVLIVSVALQEQLRLVKDTAVLLHARCEGYSKLLNDILQSDDEEFAYLYLSELARDPNLYNLPKAEGSTRLFSKNSDVEVIFDSILLDFEQLESGSNSVIKRLGSAEVSVGIRLDASRNELLVATTIISIISCTISFAGFVTGAFGMNLDNTAQFEVLEGMFSGVVAMCIAFIVVVSSSVILFFEYKGWLPKTNYSSRMFRFYNECLGWLLGEIHDKRTISDHVNNG